MITISRTWGFRLTFLNTHSSRLGIIRSSMKQIMYLSQSQTQSVVGSINSNTNKPPRRNRDVIFWSRPRTISSNVQLQPKKKKVGKVCSYTHFQLSSKTMPAMIAYFPLSHLLLLIRDRRGHLTIRKGVRIPREE